MRHALAVALVILMSGKISAQLFSPTCVTATPICESTLNTYSSSTSTMAEAGPDYGCLLSQPNPSWFYFKIGTSGDVIINISQVDTTAGSGLDVDFICWGPFTDPSTPCTAMLTASNIRDCSYSTAFIETADITLTNAGEYYLMMITNFSNMPAYVTFEIDTASTATLDCNEACVTHADYNHPTCVNKPLQLFATDHFGTGTYAWNGPGGYSSSLQNPLVDTATTMHEGWYFVTYTLDTTCSYSDSIYVEVDTCGTLDGYVYGDANTDCNLTSGEDGVAIAQVKLTQGSTFVSYAWTDTYGYYSFDVLPGTYTIEVLTTPSLPITCTGSLPHSVTVNASTITTENFAANCTYFDLVAAHVGAAGVAFFPGATHTMYPYAYFNGPTCSMPATPGELELILDPLVSYTGTVSSIPPPVVSPAPTGDTLRWSIPDISAMSWFSSSYPFYYITDAAANLGDTVHFTLTISPLAGDAYPTNNTTSNWFIVGNSYDPNNKEVSPIGNGPQGYIPVTTPELTYTINFQNTGTATAHNVYILDTIETDLDITTIKILTSSHAMTPYLLPGNIMKFDFPNIMLADSTSNEVESHGFVKFSIAPRSGLVPGDQLTNEAYIYFDFNPPILTNTALNTIEFPSSVINHHDYTLGIYPNPTNGTVNVRFEDKQSSSVKVEVLTSSGQTLYSEALNGFNGRYSKNIDLTNYANGVYILQISTDKHVVHQKLIKE